MSQGLLLLQVTKDESFLIYIGLYYHAILNQIFPALWPISDPLPIGMDLKFTPILSANLKTQKIRLAEKIVKLVEKNV
jgi:hypothetical protein